MSTFAPFEQLRGFQMIGNDRCRASCPCGVHRHGDRSRGLSGRLFGNAIALKCWSGCTAEDILAAMGLGWSALFLDHTTENTLLDKYREVARQKRAVDGLNAWRDAEVLRSAEELRTRDGLIRTINTAVFNGDMPVDIAMDLLGDQYDGYSGLEYNFEVLRTGIEHDLIALWRQRGGTHAAA